MKAKELLRFGRWSVSSALWILGCGGAETPDVPVDSGTSQGCSKGRCCPAVDWMLITPSETGVGGKIDLDASVQPTPGRPFTLKWTAEGGPVEASRTAHARYTCRNPGVYNVRLVMTNAWCETSQESHIVCVD